MKQKAATVLLYLCILLNVFDVLLHVAIGQPETLRIAANTLVVMASFITIMGWRPKTTLAVGLFLHVALNGAFIIQNGIGNLGVLLILLTAFLMLASLFTNSAKK